MREDIKVPESEDVYVIAVSEWNEEKWFQQWNIYLVNLKKEPIEMVLILARGYSDDKKTSTIRHGLGDMPPNEIRKIEMVDEQVFVVNNEYLVTYLYNGKMLERTFTFPANSIKEENQKQLKDSKFKGVIAD